MNNPLAYYKTLDEAFVPDAVFPSDNDFGIPTLLESHQAKTIDLPFVCFGEQRRTMAMNGMGTLHFYTEDYRFNGVYEHPEKILKHFPRNIIEPNFSIFDTTPPGLGLAAIYKKRYIARACQNVDIRVFVDLNVSPRYYKANMLGVPKGWSSFATRGYSDRIEQLEVEYLIAQNWAEGNPLTFVVYGGGRLCEEFCQKHCAVYITPIIAIKNKIKRLEKMNEIAFDPHHCDYNSHLLPLYKNQIKNYSKLLENG